MTINFELVSPEEKLIEQPVTLAVIPGTEGDMGVGAGHASFVVALKPGVVHLYQDSIEGESQSKIFIAGGFADVTGENCTVLAEQAVNVNDLDQKEVEQEIQNLNEDLDRAQDEVEAARIKNRLALAKAKLTAITGQIVL